MKADLTLRHDHPDESVAVQEPDLARGDPDDPQVDAAASFGVVAQGGVRHDGRSNGEARVAPFEGVVVVPDEPRGNLRRFGGRFDRKQSDL